LIVVDISFSFFCPVRWWLFFTAPRLAEDFRFPRISGFTTITEPRGAVRPRTMIRESLAKSFCSPATADHQRTSSVFWVYHKISKQREVANKEAKGIKSTRRLCNYCAILKPRTEAAHNKQKWLKYQPKLKFLKIKELIPGNVSAASPIAN
jgi:hypothetical protein